MTADGYNQYAMIFGMTMTVPYASVPVAAGLTVLQMVASLVRDGGDWHGHAKEVAR
jgi:hypothetical protein